MSKARELAALLVCMGVACLFPPIALIFSRPGDIFGIPRPFFYILVVWVLLIIGARIVTKRLTRPPN